MCFEWKILDSSKYRIGSTLKRSDVAYLSSSLMQIRQTLDPGSLTSNNADSIFVFVKY